MPFVLTLLGMDFSAHSEVMDYTWASQAPKHVVIDSQFHALSGAFIHTLLEWTAFCVAVFVVFLAFSHYQITHDVTTPIIGVAFFMAGCMDAFHTLAANRLIDAVADNRDLIPFTWAICRTFSALIMITGVSILLLRNTEKKRPGLYFIITVSVIFGLIAYTIIHLSATASHLPQTTFPDALITRPYDAFPLILFLFAGGVAYPRLYKRHPSLFSHALIISAVPEVVTQLHMAFGSTMLFDNHFNIAHFMKVVAYMVPLIGLILDYIRTHQTLQTEIAARKENERQLKQAIKVAKAANRTKAGFLATMSHEIRTPMNVMLGTLGLLRDTSLNDKQRQLVKTGRESGELLLTIINDILDFSKMEAEKLQLERTSFNLHRLLNQSIELLQPQAEHKGLTLQLTFDSQLPHYAEGDPDRLRQVLLNLISNAIKFTPSGSINVLASSTASSNEHFTLYCSVQDTGIGIPQELHSSLFKEFSMADHSHSRTQQGTGLGLAICKRLVSLMNGKIDFDSDTENGSNFFFTVELNTVADKGDTIDAASTETLKTPAANTRVLLAEDNPANQLVTRIILEYADLQVDIVANGQEAVNSVSSLPYDIVLMDISMPEMDGMEATRLIRKLPSSASEIPIIALTAHTLPGDKEHFLEAGMNDYLPKPFDRKVMLHCIAQWTKAATAQEYNNKPTQTAMSQDNKQYVDEKVLQQLAQDIDVDVIPTLIAHYILDAKKRMVIIDKAIKDKNFSALAFESHSLGSSAAVHGNPWIHNLSRKIESLCQEEQHEQALTEARTLQAVAEESFRLLEQRAKKGF